MLSCTALFPHPVNALAVVPLGAALAAILALATHLVLALALGTCTAAHANRRTQRPSPLSLARRKTKWAMGLVQHTGVTAAPLGSRR
jgi:hypothetical protein